VRERESVSGIYADYEGATEEKGVMRGVGPGQTRAGEHIHSAPVIGLRIANHRSKRRRKRERERERERKKEREIGKKRRKLFLASAFFSCAPLLFDLSFFLFRFGVKPSFRGKLLEDDGERRKRKVSVFDLDTRNSWNIITSKFHCQNI